jgi:limonene 1,2-monooxygenase
LMRWHNEYITATLQRPGAKPYTSPEAAVEEMSGPGSAAVIGTPDDLVKMIKGVIDKSGGFGTCVGFVHDWANVENTFRSWDMVARYVIPEINGYTAKLRESEKHLQTNRAVFDRAGQAIMAKIMENADAAEALKVTTNPRVSAAGAQVPRGLKDQAAE